MQGDDVALGEDALHRGLLDAVLRGPRPRAGHRGRARGPAAERLQHAHHLGADMAVADDADGHLGQLLAGEVGAVEVAAPFAPAQRLVAAGDQAGLGEDGADGELGDRAGVAAGRVDDADLARPRRRHVDIDGPPRETAISLRLGQPVHHAAGERRELRHQRSRHRRRRRRSRRGRPWYSLRPSRPGPGIAVLHRLVGPGQLEGADLDVLAARARGSPSRTSTAA